MYGAVAHVETTSDFWRGIAANHRDSPNVQLTASRWIYMRHDALSL